MCTTSGNVPRQKLRLGRLYMRRATHPTNNTSSCRSEYTFLTRLARTFYLFMQCPPRSEKLNMGGPDPNRNERNLFKKRSKTLAKKSRELARLSGAKVYLLIMHERANIVYNSNREKNFPPPDNTLVSPFRLTSRIFIFTGLLG